ncbi:MAG TPA: pilus assembly protein TadG-related protein [Candidatus Obscuribacterales bacterium]
MHLGKQAGVRSNRGALSLLLLSILLIAAFMVCALAMDIAHCTAVRTELQAACDAGALGGAEELAKDPIVQADITRAENYALLITERNNAEAIPVSNSNSDTTVTAAAFIPPAGSSDPRTVTVTATRNVKHMFGKIFGGWNDNIQTTGVAGVSHIVAVDNGQWYPLSVDLNVEPTSGTMEGIPLNLWADPTYTDRPFTIVLNPQGSKNGAWLRWEPEDGPLYIGQTVGVFNGTQANKVRPIEVGDFLYLPLIEGGPPYNKDRVIIGLVGFLVTSINFPQEITGLIRQPIIVNGTPGTPLPIPSGPGSNFLTQNQIWKVWLIR